MSGLDDASLLNVERHHPELREVLVARQRGADLAGRGADAPVEGRPVDHRQRQDLAIVRLQGQQVPRVGGPQAVRLVLGHRVAVGLGPVGEEMLAVARALVGAPKVLMLDEPSAGLSPKLVGVVFDKLRHVRNSGVTIVLVEQNVKAALGIADRAAILVEGRERKVAAAAELAGDPGIAGYFLGRRGGGP